MDRSLYLVTEMIDNKDVGKDDIRHTGGADSYKTRNVGECPT